MGPQKNPFFEPPPVGPPKNQFFERLNLGASLFFYISRYLQTNILT